MMCYRDRTFCSATDCRDPDCDRKMTEGVERAAAQCGLMVSVAELHKTCADYLPPLKRRERE